MRAAHRVFTIIFLLWALLIPAAFLSTATAGQENASAAPMIWINPVVGPPTSTVLVSGRGFDPYAAVDIYFDTMNLALTVTDGQGGLGTAPAPDGGSSGIPIIIPRDAVPGTHWITAVERYRIKAVQTPFLVRADWTQFRFKPDHKGFNPYENILTSDTVASLGLHWNYPLDTFNSYSSPAVANGVVYFAPTEAGTVFAVNATTGTLLWKYHTGGLNNGSSPAIANGVVYIGSWGLYALNASTGALLWKFDTGRYNQISSPAVVNGVVYFASTDNSTLYALSAGTGAVLWKYRIGWYVLSSPAVANSMVYIGSTDGVLYALNAATGTLRWTFATLPEFDSSPAVANGIVYFGGSLNDHNVYALNASNGVLLWKYATEGTDVSSPAVVNGVVYIGSTDGTLYALNAATGVLVWRYRTDNYSTSSPAVAGGVVYFGSRDGNLYAFHTGTGALLWKYTIGNYCDSSPVVANGAVYTVSFDGSLYAFDLTASLSSERLSPPERPDPAVLIPNYSLQPGAVVTRASGRVPHTFHRLECVGLGD
jgi:outer membrane protein assembly factor BamB